MISRALQKIVYEEMDKVLYNRGVYSKIAENYKNLKDNGIEPSEDMKKYTAIGGYIHDNGFEGSRDNYKPYYDYLKYGNKPQQQEKIKEESIMIEDNNYETPYSFEYEPYFSNNNYSIIFDHEVDTSDSIQMIEELYNENNIEEVDSNDVINIMDILTNKISKVKKAIIHYISNYRPMYNQYTDTIETVLIE